MSALDNLLSRERAALWIYKHRGRRTLHQPGQFAETVMPRDVRYGSAASSLVPNSTAALVILYSRYATLRSVRGSATCSSQRAAFERLLNEINSAAAPSHATSVQVWCVLQASAALKASGQQTVPRLHGSCAYRHSLLAALQELQQKPRGMRIQAVKGDDLGELLSGVRHVDDLLDALGVAHVRLHALQGCLFPANPVQLAQHATDVNDVTACTAQAR